MTKHAGLVEQPRAEFLLIGRRAVLSEGGSRTGEHKRSRQRIADAYVLRDIRLPPDIISFAQAYAAFRLRRKRGSELAALSTVHAYHCMP